jgi:hypothetical protein
MERKNSQVEITYDKLARMQVAQGTQWGRKSFEDREGSLDNYGKHSFGEYLDFVADIHMEQNMILSCCVDF